MRNAFNRLIKYKYNVFIKGLGKSVRENPKKFWSFVKAKKCNSTMPTCVQWVNLKSDSSQEKCELFNRYFHSVYKSFYISMEVSQPAFANLASVNLSKLGVSQTMVLGDLAKLDVHKAVVPDSITELPTYIFVTRY